MLEQRARDRGGAFEGGDGEGVAATRVRAVGVGAVLEQHEHGLQALAGNGDRQWRAAPGVGDFEVRAGLREREDGVEVSVLGGGVHRRGVEVGTGGVQAGEAVGVGAGRDQRAHDRRSATVRRQPEGRHAVGVRAVGVAAGAEQHAQGGVVEVLGCGPEHGRVASEVLGVGVGVKREQQAHAVLRASFHGEEERQAAACVRHVGVHGAGRSGCVSREIYKLELKTS